MAPASATAIQAVSDRLVAERPEPKTPDASDGQFAGLMAQFVQPIPPANPESASAHPANRESSAEGTAAGPATSAPRGETPSEAPAAAPGPTSPSPRPRPADSNPGPLSGAEPTQAPTASRVEGGTVPPSLPASLGTPVAAQSPAPSPTSEAKPTRPAVPGISSVPVQVVNPLGEANQSGVPAAPSAVPSPGPATGQAVPAPLGALTPASPVSPQASPETVRMSMQASHLGEAVDAGVSIPAITAAPGMAGAVPQMDVEPVSVPGGTAPSAVVPALGETSATAPIALQTSAVGLGPVRPSTLAVIQAISAETKPSLAEPTKPGRPVAIAEAIPSDPSLPAVKDPKMAEAPVKAAPLPTAPGPAQDTSTESPVKPPFAPPALEAQASKPALVQQSPVAHAPDGSSQAALSAFPRAADIVQTPVPTTPATPAAPPSAPVVQVEGGVHWMLKGGAQEAQLQLHPESLGQVTIHLKVEGGEVHARIWITEAASVQAVREGRPHLEMSLKEQGLQLGSFDLQQGHRPFQEAPSAPAIRDRAFSEATPARQEAPATAPVRILNAHRVELYA